MTQYKRMRIVATSDKPDGLILGRNCRVFIGDEELESVFSINIHPITPNSILKATLTVGVELDIEVGAPLEIEDETD